MSNIFFKYFSIFLLIWGSIILVFSIFTYDSFLTATPNIKVIDQNIITLSDLNLFMKIEYISDDSIFIASEDFPIKIKVTLFGGDLSSSSLFNNIKLKESTIMFKFTGSREFLSQTEKGIIFQNEVIVQNFVYNSKNNNLVGLGNGYYLESGMFKPEILINNFKGNLFYINNSNLKALKVLDVSESIQILNNNRSLALSLII